MMNERDRIREEQLERLFRMAGPESLPILKPDPGLPAHIRALAAAEERSADASRGWFAGWLRLSLAGAAVAVCVFLGGYLGYHAAVDLVPGDSRDAEILTAAWSQSGSAEDMGDLYDDEVAE